MAMARERRINLIGDINAIDIIISNDDDSHTDAVVLELNKWKVPVASKQTRLYYQFSNVDAALSDGWVSDNVKSRRMYRYG